MPPSSGIRTESSMPYMCCDGTVATIHGRSPSHCVASASRSLDAFSAVLAVNPPQVFGFGLGRPVLPDV